MKHWKQPDEKQWYSIIVDGKRIATIEDSNSCQKEIKRLKALSGIEVRPANAEELIKVKAKTSIPRRIINKMMQLSF
jgi:hypothetical protein